VTQLHRHLGNRHVPDAYSTQTTICVWSADQQHIRDQQSHTAKAAPSWRQIKGGVSDGSCEYWETTENDLRVLRVLFNSVQANSASREAILCESDAEKIPVRRQTREARIAAGSMAVNDMCSNISCLQACRNVRQSNLHHRDNNAR
jgi:hypothetical protein